MRAVTLACCLLLNALPAAAAHEHNDPALELFVDAEGIARSGTLPVGMRTSEGSLSADLVVGLKHNRLRFLTEFEVENEEAEFERLQFGLETSASSVLWLGRYHQPASVWNIFYHHGAYLQSSVSRPWLEAWEDHAGVLSQHIDGALFESQLPLARDQALSISVGAGMAPTLFDSALIPYDQARHKNTGGGKLHTSLRLQWMPDPVGEDMIGLVASHGELLVQRSDRLFGPRLQQSAIGPFASWSTGRLRLIGTMMQVHMSGGSDATARLPDFTAGYLQLDYSIHANTILYARGEFLGDGRMSDYLRVYAKDEPRRALLGVRFDLPRKQALKLELGKLRPLTGPWHNAVSVQWSVAIP
jgi:hypothetical protein